MAAKKDAAKEAEVKAVAEAAEVKGTAPKKTTVKKTTASKKETAVEKEAATRTEAAPKKTTAKQAAAPEAKVVVEYAGRKVVAKEVLAAAIENFKTAHGETEIKTIEIYVKPEENAAYYVVNGEGSSDYKVEL